LSAFACGVALTFQAKPQIEAIRTETMRKFKKIFFIAVLLLAGFIVSARSIPQGCFKIGDHLFHHGLGRLDRPSMKNLNDSPEKR
jgi:hypothetical protein